MYTLATATRIVDNSNITLVSSFRDNGIDCVNIDVDELVITMMWVGDIALSAFRHMSSSTARVVLIDTFKAHILETTEYYLDTFDDISDDMRPILELYGLISLTEAELDHLLEVECE